MFSIFFFNSKVGKRLPKKDSFDKIKFLKNLGILMSHLKYIQTLNEIYNAMVSCYQARKQISAIAQSMITQLRRKLVFEYSVLFIVLAV